MKKNLLLLVAIIAMIANSIVAQDSWTQKENFVGKRYGTIHFSIGNKGYIGTGSDDVNIKSDFWEYDPATNAWTQKADFGGGIRAYGTGFSIGNKGYAGTGFVASYNWRKDMWEYNPASNSWRQVASFAPGFRSDYGGGLRYSTVGFSIGNKGYMGTGNYRISPAYNAIYLNDFWEFDPLVGDSGTWTRKADVPEQGRHSAIGLSIGNKGYIGLGYYYYDTRLKDFWEYDPATNTWTRKADFGGIQRVAAAAFTIGNKGYVGSSACNCWVNGQYYGYLNDFWEYTPATDSWLQKATFPGTIRSTAASFSIGQKGYIGLGGNNIGALNDFWEYNPNCLLAFSLCPTDTTVYTSAGSCDKVVDYLATATGTYNPAITYIFSGATIASGSGTGSGQSFNKGITNVILTATNLCGTASCSFKVTVEDNIAPVINCPTSQNLCYNATNNYNIPLLTSSDNCGIKSIAYNITGATNRSGKGPNASGSFNSGISIIKWVVMDSSGNSSSCQSTIQIYPSLSVSIPDSYGAVFGRPNTIYIGYGWYLAAAQQLFGNGFNAMILVAIPSGGTPFQLYGIPYYHYRWSNGSTLPAIIISHPIPGNYTYSVTITDANGCEVTVQKTIRVIDVRCTKRVYGINIPGTLVCRPGNKQKCVYKFQVWAELLGNAEIGPCGVHVPQPFTANQGIGNSLSNILIANSENSWSQKNDYPGNGRYGAISFGIGKKGYMGLGSGIDTLYRDFWEFDPSNNIWTQKADFGGTARSLATAFSINKKGYVGTGLDTDGLRNDFWEYSPSLNAWNQKADFAGDARVFGTGFSIGSKGYIGTGYDIYDSYRNDFWEYNPATNNWTQKADFAGTARYSATGFSIGNKGYIGTGIDNERLRNDFWEYNPVTNNWLQKADFAGTDRYMTTGLRIGNKGYIGLGYDTTNTFKNDFWEYNPSDNTWIRQADFAGGVRMNATGFNIGGRGYIGTGYNEQQLRNDFWEYVPNCNPVEVNIADVYTVNPGGNPNTIYKGYGPVSLTLTATASGGFTDEQFNYTYSWSTGQTTPSIIISPQIPGTYNYSVNVSDMNGCTSSTTKIITVVDVRCGNKLEKVTICQVPPGNPANSHEICVSKNAVAAHLNKGSYLGNCNAALNKKANTSIFQEEVITDSESPSLSIYPNPNNGSFTLEVRNSTGQKMEIRIIDQNGRTISTQNLQTTKLLQLLKFNIGAITKGIYSIQVITANGIVTKKMIIQ